MTNQGFNVVTGAFGYTGRYITENLLKKGTEVKTLTDHPDRPNSFGGRIQIAPYNFDSPSALTESLRGADILYNTYWARFSYGGITYDKAVENSRKLIAAAKDAGVRRIVQITVTGAFPNSPIPYFRGKGQVEQAVIESGLSYAILRPCMIFGPDGILVNDIAWLLRRFPIFAVPGKGDYRVSPIFVRDLAELAVKMGEGSEDGILDAAGPETLTFDEMVRLIASAIHSRALIIHTNPKLALLMATLAGKFVKDIILEQWEIDAMFAGLLSSDSPPVGKTKLSDWLMENAETLGRRYYSELAKNYRHEYSTRTGR
ncbi:MAG: NAD(P)H-binding protein [Armatimonadota bacterium]